MDRQWTTADGRRILGRALQVTFGSALRNAEVLIVEADGTRWPLLVEDLSLDDIKWIKSLIHGRVGELLPAAGERILIAD